MASSSFESSGAMAKENPYMWLSAFVESTRDPEKFMEEEATKKAQTFVNAIEYTRAELAAQAKADDEKEETIEATPPPTTVNKKKVKRVTPTKVHKKKVKKVKHTKRISGGLMKYAKIKARQEMLDMAAAAVYIDYAPSPLSDASFDSDALTIQLLARAFSAIQHMQLMERNCKRSYDNAIQRESDIERASEST